MTEWFALAIPLLATAVSLVFWRRRFVWWEIAIPTAVCVLLIAISRFTAEYCITGDTEYWGSYAMVATYKEAWTETYTETTTSRDSKGRTHTKTQVKTRHHPPEWYISDNIDQNLPCNSGVFEELVNKWGNKEHRNSGHGEYVTIYDNKPEHFVPLTTEHRYTNRVRVSKSVFRQYKAEAGSVPVYDYPPVTDYYQPAVVGAGKGLEKAQALLDNYNAKQGPSKEVRLFLLVFPEGGVDTGIAQESYWEGGNKNEVTVCIGVRGGKITWCYPFTWCEVDLLKVKLRQEIEALPVADLALVAQKMTGLVDSLFVRKHFSEFKYISVQLPGWVVATIYGLTLLASVGTLIWVCNNQFEGDCNNWSPRNRAWRNYGSSGIRYR